MPSLQVNNLSFSFDKCKQVLDTISFTINSGEQWSVIGKNGSGKSTLIRCLARLEKTENGAIAIDNNSLHSFSSIEMARICAYVPQATLRIPPNFTVREYVLMGRYPYRGFPVRSTADDRSIVGEALELTDITALADRSMKNLSGGELQRVYIAGAVAQRTAIMLLDEPVSFLDPMHSEMIHATMDRIHREYRTTMVTVTHDINAALQRNTHILALHTGKKVFAGTTETFRLNATNHLKEIYGIPFETVTGGSSGTRWFMPAQKIGAA
jgi:ABC-type cobalamin/Fe3+-siderophores transport system ATPase subunit